MTTATLVSQAASRVRYLRKHGCHLEARAAAFEARRAIGAAALHRCIA